MSNCDRHKLLGTYTTPNIPEGTILWCQHKKRWMPAEYYSDGPISWPMGRRPGSPAYGYIVFGDLAKALRSESAPSVGWLGDTDAMGTSGFMPGWCIRVGA
jgi:hypothetical protein